MKVRALKNIIYRGRIYKAGSEFEASEGERLIAQKKAERIEDQEKRKK